MTGIPKSTTALNSVAEKPITAEEWTKKLIVTFTVTLPESKVFVELKKLSLVELAIAGYLPLVTVESVLKTCEKMKGQTGEDILARIPTGDQLKGLRTILEKCAIQAFVSPHVSDMHLPSSVYVGDIPTVDLMFIMEKCIEMQVPTDMQPFCDVTAGEGGGENSTQIPSETVGAVEDNRSDNGT